MPPWGHGPDPGEIGSDDTRTVTNPLGTVLAQRFPKIDYFISCVVDSH
jgi:hypothetical protein